LAENLAHRLLFDDFAARSLGRADDPTEYTAQWRAAPGCPDRAHLPDVERRPVRALRDYFTVSLAASLAACAC
jgi:hypothetical protein